MEQPKVSVIVPVCNVEKYVKECVESLINQSLQEIEIICVNDGSSDSSLYILRELEKRDNRIRVIDKGNTGYGDTVNTGIRVAKGEYIGILESDDFAESDMYEKLYSKAKENSAELVKGNYYNYYTESNNFDIEEYLGWLPYEKILTREERNVLIFSEPAIWCGIYKKNFLLENDISFLSSPGASYQDTSFAYKTALCAKNVMLIKDPVLFYRKDNENSSVKDDRKVFCICDEFEEIYRFITEKGWEEDLAVYAKAMYYRYKWNLERLKVESRAKFLLKMYEQFRKASFSGWLDKRYWNDVEWEYIHKLIFALPDVYSVVIENGIKLDTDTDKRELLLYFLRNSFPLFIYGAGKKSLRLVRLLQEHGIDPDGVAVTDLVGNPGDLEGISVMNIERVSKSKRDALILLGVTEKHRNEIMTVLKERYMSGNCFVITDRIWALLEKSEKQIN